MEWHSPVTLGVFSDVGTIWRRTPCVPARFSGLDVLAGFCREHAAHWRALWRSNKVKTSPDGNNAERLPGEAKIEMCVRHVRKRVVRKKDIGVNACCAASSNVHKYALKLPQVLRTF